MAGKGSEPIPIGPRLASAKAASARWRSRYRRFAVGAATAVFVGSFALEVKLVEVSSLIAALGILAASLLGVFTQLAVWRGRLSERAARFEYTESFDRSHVDRAASLTLAASIVSLGAAVLLAGTTFSFERLANLITWVASISWAEWLVSTTALSAFKSLFSALTLTAMTWIFVTLLFVAADLVGAYRGINEAEEKEAKAKKAHDDFRRRGRGRETS